MKILADIDIPFVENYFGPYGELLRKPGRKMTRDDLSDVDLLLVRSVTRVNENLLNKTPVKFVGSVATGIDHLDTAWLDRAGIQWRAAGGYNAVAVSDYVISVIAALFRDRSHLPALRVGVVGVGHTGSHVAARFKCLGLDTLLCDPPRAEREKDFGSLPLSAFSDMDLVTVHTPLTRTGKYPTYHMINEDFLKVLGRAGILINASRGAVLDAGSLANTRESLRYCFDVWENEPAIDLTTLQSALIATPHLAGHSLQSRCRGIDMIYHAACETEIIKPKMPVSPVFPQQTLAFDDRQVTWQDVVLRVFDPLATTVAMKAALLKQPQKCATLFDKLRQQYIGAHIKRHEFDFTTVVGARLTENDHDLLTQLGIKII